MITPWLFAVLAAVAFRLTRAAGWDDITATLRARLGVSDQTYAEWIPVQHLVEERGEPSLWESRTDYPKGIPFNPFQWWLARLIRCPWCAGFWVSMIVSLAASGAGLQSWAWAVPIGLALSSVVGLVARHLDP